MAGALTRAAGGRAIEQVWSLAQAERERWSLWLPVGLAAGIALYFALPIEPPLWPALALTACAGLGAFFARHQDHLRPFCVAAFMIAVGLTIATGRTQSVAAPIIERATGTWALTGTVEIVERREAARTRLTVRVERLGRLSPERLPVRVRITLRNQTGDVDPATLGPGARIRVPVRLMPPPQPAAPGAFDFARMAYFDRLGGVGYAVGGLTRLNDMPDGWRLRLAEIRDRVSQRIRNLLPGPAGGVAAAVVTGDRSGIREADWEALRLTGLAHLLAISGLHMTAIAAFVFFLVRGGLALIEPIALTQPVKKWAAIAAALAGFGYLLLSGLSIPTQRAFIMVLIAMIAILLDRPVFSMRTVAVAATLVLLVAPESLMEAGFQMSFAAVTALIAAYETWRRWRPPHLSAGLGPVRRGIGWLGGIAMTTVIASLAVAPFAAFHFNRLGVYDLVANLLAVPVFSLGVMPTAMLSLVMMPFGWEALPLWILGFGIDAVLGVAHWVSGWPYAALAVAAMPGAALGTFVLGGLWMCLWQGRWRLAGLGAILLGLMIGVFDRAPDLLIARDGELVALRMPDGRLAMTSRESASYDALQWRRRNGESAGRQSIRPDTHHARRIHDLWQCDGEGCIADLDGNGLVSFAKTADAHRLDCTKARILVSSVPVRRHCPGPEQIIDRFDIWWGGAHALSLKGQTIRVETARARRGERPWVLPRGPRYGRSRSGQ